MYRPMCWIMSYCWISAMWIIMEHCLVLISTCKSNAFTLNLTAAKEYSFSLYIYLYVFL